MAHFVLKMNFGQEHPIPPSDFPQILNLNRKVKPKLVLISACHSETVAAKIFDLDIPVIAIMGKRSIHERAAILFNQLFFRSWTHGMTLSKAFEEGVKAVRNNAEVGDQAYSVNPFWMDDPVPWSQRFLLKANSEQKNSRLFTEEIPDVKNGYRENNISTPINLPQLTRHFTGRNREIHEILKLMQRHKIIAVIGAFGLGKTEVVKAIALYLQERGRYGNGIFWASAKKDENRYHLKDLESLYNSILKTKNGELSDKTPLEKKAEEVNKIFSFGETLLVLDNLEIIEKDMKLQAFLKDLPESSRILIATRHNIPRLAHNYNLDFMTSDSCIKLFLSTLKGTGYFQTQEESLESAKKWAKKIFDHLGGHPIALEITAGRGLSCTLEEIWEELIEYPKEILEEIDDITGESRGVWTSLKLSYDDLNEKQKKLFYRLSIFTGPVDKKVIRETLKTPGLTHILDGLVRRSLVKHQNKTYFFLPVIKMYAESKLEESEEEVKSLHKKAVDYFKQQEVSEKIRALDHLKILCRQGDKETREELLDFTLEIDKVLFKRGQWNLDKDILTQSLEVFKELKGKEAEGQLLPQLGKIARHRGELEKSEEVYRNALKIFENLKCPEGVSKQWDNLGMVYRRRGELNKAESAHKKALTISREHGNKSDEGINLMRLGLVYRKMGELDNAEKAYNESLEIREQLDDTTGVAAVWANIGIIYKYRGNLDEAENIVKKSLHVFQKDENSLSQANQLNKLGTIYFAQGKTKPAEEVLKKALEIFSVLDNRSGAASTMNHLGIVYKEQEKLKDAQNIIEKGLNLFETSNNLFGKASSLVKLGQVLLDMKELDKAESLIQESLKISGNRSQRLKKT